MKNDQKTEKTCFFKKMKKSQKNHKNWAKNDQKLIKNGQFIQVARENT